MSADFTPTLEGYNKPGAFRFWCQKVLPLVYDDSLSYYELLCKVITYINNLIADNRATIDNVGLLLDAFNELQDYVNDFIDNLDLDQAVNDRLDEMVEDGELFNLIEPYLDSYTQFLTNKVASSNIRPIGMNKVIIIGDSYCTQSNYPLPNRILDRLGITNVADYCISVEGSTGFAHSNAYGHNFLYLLNATENQITAADVTHILVLGGANDSQETNADILSAMETFRNRVEVLYPNATIYTGFLAASTTSAYLYEYARISAIWIGESERLIKYKYLSGVENIMHNRALFSDNVHPNETGLLKLAGGIVDALVNGYCSVYYCNMAVATLPGLGGVSRPLREMVADNLTRIWTSAPLKFDFESPVSVPFNLMQVADLTGGIVTGNNYTDCGTSVGFWVVDTTNHSHYFTGFVCVADGVLYLRCPMIAEADTITANTIAIDTFNIVIPTITA